ncbi:MAG TPA: galactose-1-phosphate uridylyltransferase [Methanomicrobiales archaeon]|nr:galactose-1-phosphate uridylyltransferase [Methanomicrobiales archaeon]
MKVFTGRVVETGKGRLHLRRETLTGLSCRISSERIKRGIDRSCTVGFPADGCPFCDENLLTATPTFPDGRRILVGESVTFPNLYPFAEWHTVTVISRDHQVSSFTTGQLVDAITGLSESLRGHDGYPSVNWNFLPSAGASLAHPHLQGLVDREPSPLAARYLAGSRAYQEKHGRRYSDDLRKAERKAGRVLIDGDILWLAHAVPLGEKEIRGILPVSRLSRLGEVLGDLARDLLGFIAFYEQLGTRAFNFSLFFDREGPDRGFNAFCSLIARINPNQFSMSDSSFMERLHLEPVILTLPEDLARMYRERKE